MCSTVLLISHGLYLVMAEASANAISPFFCVQMFCVKDTGRGVLISVVNKALEIMEMN